MARSVVRSLSIIALVAAISGVLSHWENAEAVRDPHPATSAWVRTVDGWEPSTVLTASPFAHSAPALHPALVASFQLAASVFFLLAFPYPKSR